MPPIDITSTKLDQGPTTPAFTRNLSRVNFEIKTYNPFAVEPRKPSIFSRILHTLGGFAPLAAIAAPFTGGLSLIGAAAFSGLGAMGNKSIQNHYAREGQANQRAAATVMTYPGMSPASFASDPTLALISDSRQDASSQAVQSISLTR